MSVSKQFVLAGEAIFTIEVPPGTKRKDGTEAASHYTFRVEKVEASDRWPVGWFVKTLIGPDTRKDYGRLGKLDEFTGQIKTVRGAIAGPTSFRFRLLNRILARTWSDDAKAFEQFGYIVHHEGMCGRCGAALTVPQSIKDGFGPECRKHVGLPPIPAEPKVKKERKPRVRKVKPTAARQVGDVVTGPGGGVETNWGFRTGD